MNAGRSPAAPLRVGVLGGAFDPPHAAHLALARAAQTQIGLDVLHVVPTGGAWHKSRPLSAAAHRLAMSRLAWADVPGVCVDGREIERVGPSYTLHTLQTLQAQYGAGVELALVVGADQLRRLPSWQGLEQIVRLATLYVAARAEQTGDAADFDLHHLSADVARRVRRIAWTASPLSSTALRSQISAGVFQPAGLSADVARYISDHQLYRNLS